MLYFKVFYIFNSIFWPQFYSSGTSVYKHIMIISCELPLNESCLTRVSF